MSWVYPHFLGSLFFTLAEKCLSTHFAPQGRDSPKKTGAPRIFFQGAEIPLEVRSLKSKLFWTKIRYLRESVSIKVVMMEVAGKSTINISSIKYESFFRNIDDELNAIFW